MFQGKNLSEELRNLKTICGGQMLLVILKAMKLVERFMKMD